MSTPRPTRLARLLSDDRAALEAAWAAALGAPPPSYAVAWLDGLAEMLDGAPDRAAGWVARLAEGARAEGLGPERVIGLIWGLRDAAASVAGAAAVHAELGALLERHTLHFAQYCAQSEREARAAAQRRLRTLAESVNLPFAALDAEGSVALANGLLAQALGLGADAMAGRELAEFCDAAAAAELRRCFRQKRAAPCRQFTGGIGAPHQAAARMRFNVRPMYDAAGLRDGWAVSLEPLEIRGEDVAQYLQAVFDQVADAIRAGLQVVQRDGRVLYQNPMCRGLLAGAGPAGERLCCEMIRRRAGRGACVCGQVFETGEVHTEELLVTDGEDVPRWFNLTVVPLRDGREGVGQAVTILRDVTTHRQLEARVMDQHRNSLASQVAVSVAHQLRNPLGVMLGFAEMLEAGLAADKIPMVAERLLRNAMRCKQIVEDVLEFGHGQPGARGVVGLERVLEDLVRPAYAQSRVPIAWALAAPLGGVACVPAQLAQVFHSLIDNAVRAARTAVAVRAWREGDWLLARVEDDGAGVPPEIQARIFLPFFTTRKDEAAVGLGLSLSQSVVSEYGGQLTLETERGPGASFLVRLPVAREPAPAIAPAPPPPRRVLIVDDELDLLDMLGTAMELRGYAVDMAGSAAEAMALIDRHAYCGAVFDVQLPGVLGGPELFAHVLQAQPELASRTLFITADTMNFETQRFLERVRRPSLEKPFLVSEFVSRMERLLGEEGAVEAAP